MKALQDGYSTTAEYAEALEDGLDRWIGQHRAIHDAHRLEVALLQTQIERLRAVLREHGIPLPEEDSRLGASDGEHLQACRSVVTSAYELLANLDTLRQMVGSGAEFLKGEPWRG